MAEFNLTPQVRYFVADRYPQAIDEQHSVLLVTLCILLPHGSIAELKQHIPQGTNPADLLLTLQIDPIDTPPSHCQQHLIHYHHPSNPSGISSVSIINTSQTATVRDSECHLVAFSGFGITGALTGRCRQMRELIQAHNEEALAELSEHADPGVALYGVKGLHAIGSTRAPTARDALESRAKTVAVPYSPGGCYVTHKAVGGVLAIIFN